MRGIVGGVEQGVGLGGGMQLSSGDSIPPLDLRATALTAISDLALD